MIPIPLSGTPSAQDVFDTIVRHASTMKDKSMLSGTQFCAYRSYDGGACFVGCLLTDEQAAMGDRMTRQGGGGGVSDLGKRGILPSVLMPHLDLLEHIQPTHDEQNLDEWPQHFREIATERGLSTAVIDEVFGVAA